MNLVIRKAKAEDLGGIEELWVQLIDHVHALDERHWQRAPDGPRKFREWIEEGLTDSKRVVFVAEEEGKLLGYGHCILKEGPSPMKPRLDGFISDFIVDKQARRKGTGSKLLSALEDWAGRQGAQAVTLSVAARNELGRAFWDAMGFEHWTSMMWKPLGKSTGAGASET